MEQKNNLNKSPLEPMKEPPVLQCSHCAQVFKSLHLLREEAYKEVLMQFTQHMQTKHTKKIEKLMQGVGIVTAISATVILISKNTTLLDNPETQMYNPIYEEFSKLIEEIEKTLGVEVSDTKVEEKDTVIDMKEQRADSLPLPHAAD